MSIHILFYALFLSQIILISYYYPTQIIKRIDGVLKKFPPKDYPKLYPESLDNVITGKKRYQLLNQIILIIGLVLMGIYAVMSSDYEGNQKFAEGLPLMFGMIQFIPFMLLEISSFRQFKLMREANKSTSRTAGLSPRKLFDYVSPISKWVSFSSFVSNVSCVKVTFHLSCDRCSVKVLHSISHICNNVKRICIS